MQILIDGKTVREHLAALRSRAWSGTKGSAWAVVKTLWGPLLTTAMVLGGSQFTGCGVRPRPVPPAPLPVPPDPKPPEPPGPVVPDDPAFPALKAAWDKEVAVDKAVQKDRLSALYRNGADLNIEDKTAGQVFARMHVAAQALIQDGLPEVRKALAAELDTKLPTDPKAAADPALFKAQFARVSKLLDALK